MRIRIMGSIIHPAEKPKQYFGMLDIYTDEPLLFLPFNFTVLDNQELHPRVLFFHENMQLFLEADGMSAPEDMELESDQLAMYQILSTAVMFGIFNMLSRNSHGFNYTPLVHQKSKRRQRKNKFKEDMVVPFILEIINLDEKQARTIIKLSSKHDFENS
ncbi:MAG: hypothetical protein Q8R26_00575 [bacterium]|nr:hypothetical protein [bacterium]